MPRFSNGFVLLAVLIFMQIFSLLGLYGLAAVVKTDKDNQAHWKRETALVEAENRLYELEQVALTVKPSCLRAVIPSADLVKKNHSWWSEHACSLSSATYQYYFTEMIGYDVCVVMNRSERLVPARFYRITLLSINNRLHSPKMLLQSTIAIPDDQSMICPDKVRIVKAGVQSRRELY